MTDRPAQSAPRCKPWCGIPRPPRRWCSPACIAAGESVNPYRNHAPFALPERPGEALPLFEAASDYDQTAEEARAELEPDGVDVDAFLSRQPTPPADVAGQTLPPRWERFIDDIVVGPSWRLRARADLLRVLAEHDAERAGPNDSTAARISTATADFDHVPTGTPGTVGAALGLRPAEQPAPTCRCGSGAHPRRCQVHPNGYAEHCAELSAEYAAEEQPATCTCNPTFPGLGAGCPVHWPKPAPAAPDGGLLSNELTRALGDLVPISNGDIRRWRDSAVALEDKLAAAEAKVTDQKRDLDKWCVYHEGVEARLSEAGRDFLREKAARLHAESKRDEERARFIELLETYEPRRDVPSDWSYQGALERIAAMVREWKQP